LLLYQAAFEAIDHLLDQACASRAIPAVDLDGCPLGYIIDTDYWAGGRLEQLIQRLSEIREQLCQPAETPGSDALYRLMEVELPEYRSSLEVVALDARINALNSQLRINIADLVVCALQEQGFSLEGFTYDQEDMRLGFGARLSNIEGNEVVLHVSPTGSQLGENELQIQSLDRQHRTEHELRRRWYEINRSLTAFGVAVGQVQQLDSTPARRPRAPLLQQPASRPQLRQPTEG
jgi:hypothetical protein